jgi:hypothetical protein
MFVAAALKRRENVILSGGYVDILADCGLSNDAQDFINKCWTQ